MRFYLLPSNRTFQNFMFDIFTSCLSVYHHSTFTNFTLQFDLASFVRDVVNPIMTHVYFVSYIYVLHLHPVWGNHVAAWYGCSAYMVRHKPVSRVAWELVFAIQLVCYIDLLIYRAPAQEVSLLHCMIDFSHSPKGALTGRKWQAIRSEWCSDWRYQLVKFIKLVLLGGFWWL